MEDTTAPTIEAATTDPVYTKDIAAIKAEDYVTTKDVSNTTVAFTSYQKLDSLDAEPTADATTTILEEEGFYKATITATDASKNESDTTVTIVYDKTAPTIEGLADTTVESEPTEDQFTPTATDAIDGEVEVTKTLEKTGDNQYTVTAKATDKAGNEATQTATITVEVPQPVAQQPAETTTTTKKSTNASSNSSRSSSSSQSSVASQPAQEQQPVQTAPAQEAPASQPAADNSSSSSSSSGSDYNEDPDWDKKYDAAQAEVTDYKCTWCNIDFGYGASAKAEYREHMINVHQVSKQ